MKDFCFIKVAGNGFIKIMYNDIIYISGNGDYCKIFTSKEKYDIHSTLINILDKLPKEDFIRCHRSSIVNINKIDRISKDYIYINNTNISVGDAYKKELMSKINLLNI